MSVLTITKSNFNQEVLQSDKTVLIDFWAPWCGPCKMVGPIIEEIAKEITATTIVGKINVDEQPDLAAKYGVMSIPTLMVFKNGQVATSSVGLKSKQEILRML